MTDLLNEEGRDVSAAAKALDNTQDQIAPAEVRAEPLFALAAAGYELIPLNAPDALNRKGENIGKAPIGHKWRQLPAMDADEAADHLRGGFNVGVRLSPLDLVVDVDPRGFKEGDDPLARLIAEFKLAECPRVLTGGGGVHLYLRLPEARRLHESLEAYPGIEFKTFGRQVVAPGSIHPDTRRAYALELDVLSDDLAQDAPAALLEALAKPERAEAAEAGRHSPEELEAMLAGLDATAYKDQAEWLTMMMACHHATAGAGREEFIRWSTSDPAYAGDAWIIGRRWDSLHADSKGRRVTEKTLYKALHDRKLGDLIPEATAADDFADEEPAAVPALAERGLVYTGKNQEVRDTLRNAIAAVHVAGVEPALDEFKQRIVLLGDAQWLEAHGRVLDDNSLRVLRHWLVQAHAAHAYEPSKDNVYEAVSTLATHRRFNPVLDYLDGLAWDGTPRVAGLFARYFACEDDEYSRAVSTCFMVGAVRRQRQPGCKFDTFPALRGDQGWGKSSGLRALFGGDWFSDAELGDLKGKDAAMALAGKWCVELGELSSVKRSDVDTFKAFISRAVDSFRPPYGRTTTDVPRRCVMVGTVNGGGFLSDPTGNRRVWPLTMAGEVDMAGIAADRDQLWAEAAHLEARGTSEVLPRHLWAVAAERQAAETSGDPWADDLASFLAERSSGDHPDAMPADRVHTSELFDALGIHGTARSPIVARRLRAVMEQSLGWTYKASVRIGDVVRAGYARG